MGNAESSPSTLKAYFSPDQPFGPINASVIQDREAFCDLFDTETQVFAELASHPSVSLIIGRRGSGKTALLRSELMRKDYGIVVELPAAEAFQQVVKSVQEFPVRVSAAESVSRVWNYILWLALLAEIHHRSQGSAPEVYDYLKALDLLELNDPYVVMREALRKIRKYAQQHTDGDPIDATYDHTERITFGGVSFSAAKAAAAAFLRTRGNAIILMDSLDDFRLEHQENQNSLKGLLRCQAEFHIPNQPCTLRCCLPGELMNPLYSRLSDNPLKDFGNKLDVTWKADELLRIAAHRFRKYIEFHYPKAFESEFKHYRFDKKNHVKEFWERIMPERVRNRFNTQESPIGMILRHTQLLPRQLLVILNTIAVQNHRLTGNGRMDRFEEQSIRDGLYEAENTICREVFNAYRSTYPSAEEICKRCLPFLPSRFRDGDLHTVYNRHGKALSYVSDYADFRSILFGIGAVGRVVKETDVYVEGEFTYNTSNSLNVQGDELLCVHPVFAGVFNQGSSVDHGTWKVVYPHSVGMATERQL